MSVYCFRAECEYDFFELRKIINDKIKKIIMTIEYPYPDVEVEIDVDMSLEELRRKMGKIKDGHVMYQTVSIKDEYTGKRDYSLDYKKKLKESIQDWN